MKTYGNKKGFTILEIIAILVILGIIAVMVISRISSSENNLVASWDTMTSHLRLAQARALSTSQDSGSNVSSVWGVRFATATQYHQFYCATAVGCDPTNAANQTAFPGAGSIMIDLAAKGVQVTTNGTGVIAFNRFGTPFNNATLTTILANQLIITLTDNKGIVRTINITPQTGMIK